MAPPKKKGKKSQPKAAAAKTTSKQSKARAKAAKNQTTTSSDNNDLLPALSNASIVDTSQKENIEPSHDAINEAASPPALIPSPSPNFDDSAAPIPSTPTWLDSSLVLQVLAEPDQDLLGPPSNASPILAEQSPSLSMQHPGPAEQVLITSTLPDPAQQASVVETPSGKLDAMTNDPSPPHSTHAPTPEINQDVSSPHSTRAPTPEIDQDIIDRSKLSNAERSLIPFPSNVTGQKRKELYHAAFNRTVARVQGILTELSEEVGMKYEKVEADMFGCMTMPKTTRNARAWDAFVTQKMAERAEGTCCYCWLLLLHTYTAYRGHYTSESDPRSVRSRSTGGIRKSYPIRNKGTY
jgi:hypothetical protein